VKIIHLSTGHLGGAGLAARRLNAGLCAAGVDSEFYALSHVSYLPQAHEFELQRTFPLKVSGGVTALIANRVSRSSLVTPSSISSLGIDFFHTKAVGNGVIFHIHNWFNLLSHSDFALLSKKFRIVTTLHDQRLFTGGCHYSLECNNFEKFCNNCPQLPRVIGNLPSNVFRDELDLSEISYISPSKWLKSLAENSYLLRNSIGVVIPNSFFGYGTPERGGSEVAGQIRVGFAAMDPDSWIKGGDLVKALTSDTNLSKNFSYFFLSDYESHEDFWSQIDVLVAPSRADNSPNVIHEAKLWGIPVVTSNVGGIPEILTNNFDSALDVDVLNPANIAHEVLKVFEATRNSSKRTAVAFQHRLFLETSIPSHVQFYESFLR